MPRRTQVALHFEERGEGTPVLAVHGWTPDHRLMLGCLEPVFTHRPGYRRLYPDLPAMGKSAAPAHIKSSDDMLAAVQDFVDDRIGDEPFLLVGESYGGYLARGLARARREQVLGLALICPLGTAVEDAERRVPPQQVLRPDPELIATLDERTAEQFTDVAVVQTPRTLRRTREEIITGLDVADTEAMARIRQNWTLTEDPEGGEPFTRPTLILTGRQDHMVGYLDQFALLPHYPRATYAVLDTSGHNLQIEQPDLFDAFVGEWLDRTAAEA
ncbi:2-hydroxy-6-oxo-6-phenylhexa-2,4-dienoate hydrolase [Streptomyces spinoverrucosus]|uniref:2-hydroxy-6-oxo-6-phenylhexa-2,4-dienoate hydrolase n=1 Tax=Streptomyces spinoverrucosus TaxID=284043 RepID=A0A4Y3V9K9_9ACTN|nr:alpha/beta hydrolase [Streptomyces spinoverrucosus]GEC03544.1 2-hydroxy-6-oxo-6-phenylhexa-2,4-dienoate hydrolase [Streptomyces spinoverrucosus]GHB34920.1 2-hydroxy-6-oxo-6-phenylhexa-2,4-dienoate hydrolase [Streptomyces spinoverrucosus]